MRTVLEHAVGESPAGQRFRQPSSTPDDGRLGAAVPAAPAVCCHHCGTRCQSYDFVREEKVFCCQGCLIVYELLMENGLGHFYDLGATAGIRMQGPRRPEQFSYLDDPAVRQRLVDFSDEKTSRVTLHIPAIHCLACVWLLENLCHLHPGVGRSQVNFPRKEVSIT